MQTFPRLVVLVGLLGLLGRPVMGQTVSADRFRLLSGPCVERSGSGTPEGVVVGNICDRWVRTDTGTVWVKVSGTSTTGWMTWTDANLAGAIVARDSGGAFAMGALSATTGTFSGAVSATTGTFSGLTPGRLVLAGTGGLLGGDADLTFATDTLTATKGIVPISLTTPAVYGYSVPPVLALGGTGAGCTGYPNCEATAWTFDTSLMTQRLRTDPSFQSQWYVGTGGAHLNASNGGGWMPLKLSGGPTQIDGGGLHVGSTSTLDPGLGNADLDGHIGAPGYVSQTTGWRIDGFGAADFRYVYADELHARRFIADLEQALAGLQIIAKSVGQIGAAFTVPAPGSIATLTMKDLPSAANMAIFEAGDTVWLRTFSRASGSLDITNAYGTVSGYADLADGLQSWQFTRLITNGGAMTTGQVVDVDSIVLDAGVAGNGWVETNAVDGLYAINAPYQQVVTWSGNSPISGNQTLRTRLGNLRGITGVTGEYGLIAGRYAATNGAYLRASNTAFELHGIDLALWNNTTKVYDLNHTTPYQSMGAPAPTSYSSGNGFWSGMDGGVFKWRIGNPTSGSNLIAWDGSVLSIVGAITVSGTVADANNALALVGTAGATVVSGAARGLLGINSNGNPILPAATTPSGTGLFLGSDHLGYYAGGAWQTFMDNAGGFYLGGTSGSLRWTGSALTVSGTVNITGGSGYANLSDKPTLGTLAAKNAAAWATDITGIPGALGTPAASGLFLSPTHLGYYTGGAWTTYMDNAGGFYLGGTSGALQWDGSTLTINGSGTFTGSLSAASGAVTVDTSGVTLRSGVSVANQVKWTGGSAIYDSTGYLYVSAPYELFLRAGAAIFTGTLTPEIGVATTDLGANGLPYRAVYAAGYAGRSGTAGTFNGNKINLNWTGTCAELWIDTVRIGCITVVP
jgi:hypothetical protein